MDGGRKAYGRCVVVLIWKWPFCPYICVCMYLCLVYVQLMRFEKSTQLRACVCVCVEERKISTISIRGLLILLQQNITCIGYHDFPITLPACFLPRSSARNSSESSRSICGVRRVGLGICPGINSSHHNAWASWTMAYSVYTGVSCWSGCRNGVLISRWVAYCVIRSLFCDLERKTLRSENLAAT